MEKCRITVLETYYDEEKDLVQWLVEDVTVKKRYALCWPGSDLGPAVGVKVVLTPPFIKQFCNDITGKTINMLIESDMEKIAINDVDKMSEDDLHKQHDVLDKYPFYEVLQSLEEQDIFQNSLDDISSSNYPSILSFLEEEDDKD
jgi:hypothetical protein|tara:strand:+ start:8044 stop:8478 length:435 start_codon:yes stop_codon:yes gene_type:complete